MQLSEQNVIDIYPDDKIVILDEDYSIHDIWSNKFSKFPQIQIKHCLFSGIAFTYLKSLCPEVRQKKRLLSL